MSASDGWLTNSLKHEIRRLNRLAANARRKAERLEKPYATYALIAAYEAAGAAFEVALWTAEELAREEKP